MIIVGDARQIGLADNSIDAVVTDSPYGLSAPPDITEVLQRWLAGEGYERGSGGFMNKDWDSFVPGPECWKEIYRVMKPGAHLLAMAGTRTADLLGIALRLAGFQIRDTVMWLYGSGFPKSYNISRGFDRRAFKAWLDTVELDCCLVRDPHARKAQVRKAISAAVNGLRGTINDPDYSNPAKAPAKAIYSDPPDTDRRNGYNTPDIGSRHLTSLLTRFWEPLPETKRHGIWQTIIGNHEGCDVGMPPGVRVKVVNDINSARRQATSFHGAEYKGGFTVQPEGQRYITVPSTPLAKEWEGFGSGLKPAFEPVICVRKHLTIIPECDIIIADSNLKLGGLLWWMLPVKYAERFLALSPAGSERESVFVRLYAGVLAKAKSLAESEKMDMPSLPEAVSMSLNIVSLWNSILDGLSNTGNKFITSTTTGLITDLRTWNSWLSVTIPACITQAACQANGSSPFADIAASPLSDGEERPSDIPKPTVPENVIGLIGRQALSMLANIAEKLSIVLGAEISPSPNIVAKNAITGQGKGLRPNFCPIVVARKPLCGTLCENFEKWGTGGLNIDESRISTAGRPLRVTAELREDIEYHGSSLEGSINGSLRSSKAVGETTQGRWPANLILSHSEDCVRVGTKRVSGGPWGRGKSQSKTKSWKQSSETRPIDNSQYTDPDGYEQVEDWICAESCPVKLLDEQSGQCRSAGQYIKGAIGIGDKKGPASIPIDGLSSATYSDKGGASRFFKNIEADKSLRFCYTAKASRSERTCYGTIENKEPTVKPVNLCRYLERLVARPGAVILDPFCGSGSFGVAAILEGFTWVGIDNRLEACQIAKKRREWAIQQRGQPRLFK